MSPTRPLRRARFLSNGLLGGFRRTSTEGYEQRSSKRCFHISEGALVPERSASVSIGRTHVSKAAQCDEDLAAVLGSGAAAMVLSQRLQQAVANKLFPLAFIRLVQQQAVGDADDIEPVQRVTDRRQQHAVDSLHTALPSCPIAQ